MIEGQPGQQKSVRGITARLKKLRYGLILGVCDPTLVA
jgi:hypothetical protein